VAIKNTTKQSEKTHICVLCTRKTAARIKVRREQSTSNAVAHLKHHHNKINFREVRFQAKRSLAAKRTIEAGLQRMAVSTGVRKDAETAGREAYIKRRNIPHLSADDACFKLIHEKLDALIIERLLPYSAVEWERLRDLVQTALLMPAHTVRRRAM
jgi:hypothetical protein